MIGKEPSVRDDVPLEHAMLTWEPAGGGRAAAAMVVAHPDYEGLARQYMRSSGACGGAVGRPAGAREAPWSALNEAERMAALLSVAWQAVARDGVPVAAMHKALVVIPEFRERMTRDMPGCGAAA